MNEFLENPNGHNGNEENGFQKSLYKMGLVTFVDMCKSYVIALIVFVFLGVMAENFYSGIALQILLFVGFGYPLYCNAWGEGYRDLNRFQFERIQEDKFRGFKYVLISLVPHFVLALILLISYFTGMFEIMFIYRLLNVHSIVILNSIVSPDVLTVDYNILQILSYIIIPQVVTIVFVGIGYYLGFLEYAILDKIIYKKKK